MSRLARGRVRAVPIVCTVDLSVLVGFGSIPDEINGISTEMFE